MGMGVDRGILVCDRALAGSDTLATSAALAAAIKKLAPFDLVLFGTRTADSDTGQVGPQTAVLLDLPLVTWSCSIERKEAGLVVERRADGFAETFELSFPAALTIHPAWVQARDLGLAGLQTAFEDHDITTWTLADIGLSPDQVGEAGSPTKLLSLSRADRARKCEFLEGTSDEQADELVRRLLESGLIS
jgi:electron transfer flavoprotein beta subunit